jgi:hypothetical protein
MSQNLSQRMASMSDSELKRVLAEPEDWTHEAREAAKAELRSRGADLNPPPTADAEEAELDGPWRTWLAEWPGPPAVEVAREDGERTIGGYLEEVETCCLYCGASDGLQYHPFVMASYADNAMRVGQILGAAAVKVYVGGAIGGLVSGLLLGSARAEPEDPGPGEVIKRGSFLLHLVLCDSCAVSAVNRRNVFPLPVYGLHPWVETLALVGYAWLRTDPRTEVVNAALRQMRWRPSAIGVEIRYE